MAVTFNLSTPLRKGEVPNYSEAERRQVLNFLNSNEGSFVRPIFSRFLENLQFSVDRPRDSYFVEQGNVAVYRFKQAEKDFLQFAKESLPVLYKNYAVQFANKWTQEAQASLKNLEGLIKYLTDNKVSAVEIGRSLTQAELEANQFLAEDYRRRTDLSGVDKFFAVLEPVMAAIAIPGMGKALSASFNVSGAVGNAIANTAVAIANGANPEEALKTVVAGLTSYEAGEYITGLAKIQDPIMNNALGNSITQGTNALLLGNDVKTAILSGAAGGAIAGATLKATDDFAISAAAGEYAKNIASGMSSQDAMTAALVDFIATERDQAEAKIKSKAGTSVSGQPVSPEPGSQLGEPTAGAGDVSLTAPTSISSLPQFKPLPGETADAVVKVTDREGIVTYKRNITQTNPSGETTGYTITYDPEIQKFRYETAVSSKDGLGGVEVVSSETRPGVGAAGTTAAEAGSTIPLSTQPKVTLAPPTTPEVPTTPTAPTVPSEPRQDAADAVSGAGNVTVETTGSGNVTRDIIDLTGIGADTKLGQETEEVAKTETVGDKAKEEIAETGKEPSEAEGAEVNKGNNLILLGLLGGEGTLREGSQPTQQQTAAMRALSQALRVGDPGEPLFGSRVGKRKNVWNVESLRIKDELGG